MTIEDKKALRKKINEEIVKIKAAIIPLLDATQPISPENSLGRVSRMDAINNKSINDRMLRNSKEKLQNLKISISRINNSDFGICIKCKNPINFKRILLIPEVLKCVNCG